MYVPAAAGARSSFLVFFSLLLLFFQSDQAVIRLYVSSLLTVKRATSVWVPALLVTAHRARSFVLSPVSDSMVFHTLQKIPHAVSAWLKFYLVKATSLFCSSSISV